MVEVQSMRVLFVLPRLVAGGLERVTLNLIDGLRLRGVDCRIAVGRREGEWLAEAEALVPVRAYAEGGRRRILGGLRRLIDDYRPTHLVTVFADLSLLSWLAAASLRHPLALIIGVHGTPEAVGARPGFYGAIKYRLDGCVASWLYPRAAAVVAVSQGVAADLRRRHRWAPGRLAMIYSPVLGRTLAPPAGPPAAAGSEGGVRRLVAVGRLAHEKGFDLLLQALPAVLARFPVQLEIFGEGPQRERLAALIGQLGLQPHARLMGATSRPLEVIAAADLLVFPSRHEGFGVALVEALACGQQIVASDCTHGPAEILADGAYGQLVPPGDVAALSAAIIRALGGERVFVPETLRERAAMFSTEAACDAYLELLRKTASPAPR